MSEQLLLPFEENRKLAEYANWLLERRNQYFYSYLDEGEQIPPHSCAPGPLGAFQRACDTFKKIFVVYSQGANSEWGKNWKSLKPDYLKNTEGIRSYLYYSRQYADSWSPGFETHFGKDPDPEKTRTFVEIRDKFFELFSSSWATLLPLEYQAYKPSNPT